VRVHKKGQDQPGAKVESSRRTTAPDRRAQAVLCRHRHQPSRPPLAKESDPGTLRSGGWLVRPLSQPLNRDGFRIVARKNWRAGEGAKLHHEAVAPGR